MTYPSRSPRANLPRLDHDDIRHPGRNELPRRKGPRNAGSNDDYGGPFGQVRRRAVVHQRVWVRRMPERPCRIRDWERGEIIGGGGGGGEGGRLCVG
jgi:hypothetical protein